jgi:hypothetical protein
MTDREASLTAALLVMVQKRLVRVAITMEGVFVCWA